MKEDSSRKQTAAYTTTLDIEPTPTANWFRPNSISLREYGTCNVLIVAPHGFPGNDVNTEILSYELAEALDSYAIINNGKYRRPDKGEAPDPHQRVLDLNSPAQARMCRNDYLEPMLKLVKYIRRGYSKPPIVLFVHGIKDKTAAEKVGVHIGDRTAVFALGAGYAADYRRMRPPILFAYTQFRKSTQATASIGFAASLLKRLRANLGPGGDGVPGFGATKSLPTIFRGECDFPVEAVQLELKWTGFRDTEENLVGTAKKLTSALDSLTALTRASDLCSNTSIVAPR